LIQANLVVYGLCINCFNNSRYFPKKYVSFVGTFFYSRKTNVDKVISELSTLNVTFEMRRLSVGDFAWICRDRSGKELMLPYILERKRLDDLSGSIQDGRFHEQKVNASFMKQ